jgi:uncharacterized protein YjdB
MKHAGKVLWIFLVFGLLTLTGCPVETGTTTPETVNVSGVSLNESTLSLIVTSSDTLTAAVLPGNAANKKVKWEIEQTGNFIDIDPGLDVFSNTHTITVTGIAAGIAKITVTTEDGGYEKSCTVTVSETPEPAASVSLNTNSISLMPGFMDNLTATVLPGNATNKKVKWEIEQTGSFINIDPGLDVFSNTHTITVTGIAEGVAKITVTTEDGDHADECTITVDNSMSNLEISINRGSGEVPFTGTLEDAIDSVTGETADITLYKDFDLDATSITALNTHIKLLGSGQERIIQMKEATAPLFTLRYHIAGTTPGTGGLESAAAAGDADRFLTDFPNEPRSVSLTLGENITLKGISAGAPFPVVHVQERAKFVMENNSKITDHKNTVSSSGIFGVMGAVRLNIDSTSYWWNSGSSVVRDTVPSGVVPFFHMKGGTITGNTSDISVSTGNGGVFDSAGGLTAFMYTLVRLSGGSITGNFCANTTDRDITLSANTQSGEYFNDGKQLAGFFLSGNAVIGSIAIRSNNNTNTAAKSSVAFGNAWTGSAGTIDFAISAAPINSANWENASVFRKTPGSAMSDSDFITAIGKFTIGNFLGWDNANASILTQAFSGTHYISTAAGNIGKIIAYPVATSIAVTPARVDQDIRGSTEQFQATVNGTGPVDQDVIWSVLGSGGTAVNLNTAIDSDGLLEVAFDEVNSTLIVTATSVSFPLIYGTAIVDLDGGSGADQVEGLLMDLNNATNPLKTDYWAALGSNTEGIITDANILNSFASSIDTGSIIKVVTGAIITTADGITSNKWYIQANAANANFSGTVMPNTTIDTGIIKDVIRASRIATAATQNFSVFNRIQIPAVLPAQGKYYYLNTYMRLQAGSIVTSDINANDFRLTVYDALTSAFADTPSVRSRIHLSEKTAGWNTWETTKAITGTWQQYSFMVFIPKNLEGKFLDIRLYFPNGAATNAITVDMAEVEMFEVELLSDS